MLISVGSLTGSPGSTTVAALLARMWPQPGEKRLARTLLEADVDGASLAADWHASLGTAWSPGLIEFAAAARGTSGSMTHAIGLHTQAVGAGVVLVPGVPNRTAMAAAVSSLSDSGLAELARHQGLTVADVGRFRPEVAGLVRRSQATLVVCRPRLADAQLLQPVAAELVNAGARLGLVAVGEDPYSAAEVAEVAGLDGAWVWSVPVERRAARIVADTGVGSNALLRSRLGRQVKAIAEQLAVELASTIEVEGPAKRAVHGTLDDSAVVASSSFADVVVNNDA